MKISKLFHTLYAFLMFLPVMVLPLFAININQKEVEPLTAQIEETQIVNFNQYVENDLVLRDRFAEYGAEYNYENKLINETVEREYDFSRIYSNYYFRFNLNDVIILSAKCYSSDVNSFIFGDFTPKTITSTPTLFRNRFIFDNGTQYPIGFAFNTPINSVIYIENLNIFNLTQMFGSGNEPTIEQFNTWYPNDYYEYTIGRKELLYTGVVDTLDNTDVGSQFLYSLYNPLHDYFNLPNYMNLGGLYNWFLANLFSGYNSPVFFIIFTLMIYWLALSLLWLIFDVLMYVPSMIHKMLDKARME